jgi:hypothetical protein
MSNVIDNPRPDRSAKQDHVKHSGGRPGDKIPGVRKIKTTGRDPRAGRAHR